jgi:hypothetical protein
MNVRGSRLANAQTNGNGLKAKDPAQTICGIVAHGGLACSIGGLEQASYNCVSTV